MEKQSTRIGLIILIGVVAIAVTLVVRKHNKPKIDQQKNVAVVLAADSSGAITQTLDGMTRGYSRDGKLAWTQPPVISTVAGGKHGVRFANYFCAGTCPAAYGNSALAGKNKILQFVPGGDGGVPVGPPLNAPDIVLRGVPAADSLLIREPGAGNAFDFVFVSPPKPGSPSSELSDPVSITDRTTVTALSSDDRTKIATVINAPAGSSELTTIGWYQRAGSQWKTFGTPVDGKLAGSCFSGDGKHAALAGPKTVLMDFGGGGQKILPIKALKTGCTFSSDGVTFNYTDPKQKQALVLTHFDLNGVKRWARTFANANSFNAREGSNDLFQVTEADGTLLLNAKNGATLSSSKGAQAAFPGRDGVFVTADAQGKPTWVQR